MKADEVCDALDGRWPDSEYLKIREAPQSADRGGRCIDVLVLSVWKSRGYEIDAVEVKVSVADAKREIEGVNTKRGRQGGPEKAEWWYCHSNRFWMAVPASITAKVLEMLPGPWGLLSVKDDGKVATTKRAERHDAKPLPWPTTLGVMRAAAAAGMQALYRAEERGRQQGAERAQRDLERTTGDEALRRKLKEIEEALAAFKAASGIDVLGDRRWIPGADESRRLGHLVAYCQKLMLEPHELRHIEREAAQMAKLAQQLGELPGELRKILDPSTAVSEMPASALPI